MAINKVVYDGNTLIDLTGDTITAADLLEGVTAHDASGQAITGTLVPSGSDASITVVYANGGGNTSSVYNSSVLDTGEEKNTCYYVFSGGGLQSKTFSIQGSDDGSSWSTVKSTSNNASRQAGITGNCSDYRYYRCHVNSGTASVQNGYRGMMACITPEGASNNAIDPILEDI